MKAASTNKHGVCTVMYLLTGTMLFCFLTAGSRKEANVFSLSSHTATNVLIKGLYDKMSQRPRLAWWQLARN